MKKMAKFKDPAFHMVCKMTVHNLIMLSGITETEEKGHPLGEQSQAESPASQPTMPIRFVTL